MNKLTPHIEKIIDMYNNGDSPYKIAREFESYPNAIRRILQKRNIRLRDSSEAQKNALQTGSASHPTKGRERTMEEKIKISGGMMDYWDNLTDAERVQKAEQSKKIWDNMSEEKRGRINTLGLKAIRKAAKEGSKLEKVIYEALLLEGYKVDFHNKNLIPSQKMEIDLYIPKLNTIIEVDGPSHFLPIWGDNHLLKQMRYDLTKNGTLISRGFAVIRIKAIQRMSLKRKEDLIKKIMEHLKNIENDFPPKTERFIEVEL